MVFQPPGSASARQLEVAIAVIQKGGRVLVTRRAEGRHLAGFDEFPGGHRRPSEALEDCLRREVLEETGYGIRIVRLLGTKRHSYDERLMWLWFYLCEPRPPNPIAKGTALNPRWIRIQDLRRLQWPPANRRIIEKLQAEEGA